MNREVKPLAIVGMACRFPKGLEDLQTLWNALKERFSAIDRVPGDRWSVERYYSSNPIAKGKSYIRRGGFLTHDITKFDASFFGISPRDAENMDPQQRLLLEVVWEAFENSGMILPDHAGRAVGVYVGGFMLDHMITQMSAANRSAINQNTAAGMMMTMLSNRISHTFDFRGPSLSIDTACSSSLVAFHYACQDLWSSRTEMAVVGGSNVMLRPEYPMGMCKGHFLSRDGECKSFDERGDGYGRGEGAGIVLVKTLEKALRDGDQVLATVIATGSNQDGRTPGISMPSGEAQQALIESICREYAIDPTSIDYVECHGTGTAVGDPTEVKAIGATYGTARKAANRAPVIVGSIKSNIGHLEAAAGVAGVIKATLTLLHRQSTPIANLQTLNPAIPLDELNVRVSDALIDLDKDSPIRVAVNSFGYGGSNAHVILESAPVNCAQHDSHCVECSDSASSARSLPYVLPISGRSDKAIEAAAKKYAELLATDVAVVDVIYSAAHHRAHLSQRAVVMGNTRSELIAALNALSEGVEHPCVVRGSEPFTGKRQPVFVFTGMGPQWWAMGQALYRENSVYRATADEADAAFQEVSGFSILAEMLKSEEESQISRTEFAQPANLIIQLGLTAVLRSAGITPGAVVGHSVGELSSAYVAGVLSLRDAMTVAFHRSRLQATCKGTGGMLAVGQSRDRIENRIAKYAGAVSIAAVNGPGNITIAGDRDALAELAMQWTEENVFNKMLDVEVPYHSPMMDPIMDDLRIALKDVRANLPTLPLYSTVTGKQVNEVTYDADYWPLNVRQPVEFESAIRALIEDGFNNFIEVGPHPVLATSIRDCIKQAGRDCRQTLTLRRNTPEIETLHRGMMSVYTNGCEIDWSVHTHGGRFIRLPNYCWQREFFWNENDRAKQDRIANVEYPMLGIQEAPGAPVYRNDFDHEPMLYLRDHVVSGVPILPAAGYVESLFELAAIQFEFAKGFAIREAKILAPMIINAERGLDCVTSYDPTTRHATIRGLENGKLGTGQVHLTASLAGLNKFQNSSRNIEELTARLPVTEELTSFYKGLAQIGLAYGPAFQSVKELRSNTTGDQVLARVEMMPELMGNLDQYCLHPTLLDACFQSLMVMLKGSDTTYLPTGFGELCLYQRQSPGSLWCYSECVQRNSRSIECNMTLMDNDGRVVATLRSMRLTAASRRERVDQWGDPVKRQILAYDWKFCEALNEPKRLGHWLVVGSNERVAADLMEQMQSFGATVVAQVQFGEQFRHNEGVYTLRTASVEDATQMFEAVGELDGVVFLNGLSSKMDSDDPTAERAVAQIFTLTQALVASKAERKPRVYAVTQGAFAIKDFDRTVQAGQSAINGFARVAFNELDALRFSSIDLADRVTEQVLENLTLELLCDADQDEVALRGSLRLTSELIDSTLLSSDLVVPGMLTDSTPVLVRALRPDCESVGTARILQGSVAVLGDKDVTVRIETTVIPMDLLRSPANDAIEQPIVEIVGHVIAVGSQVTDLKVGDRVCGFAPKELASHISAPRDQFYVVKVDEDANAVALTSLLSNQSRASHSSQKLSPSGNKLALVHASKFGNTFARQLERLGYTVSTVTDELDSDSTLFMESNAVYSMCPQGLASAVQQATGGRGFDVVAVPLEEWMSTFDLSMVAQGGTVIDLDSEASAIHLPMQISTLVRTDFKHLMHDRAGFEDSVRESIELYQQGVIGAEAVLEVSLNDLAWRKLPLGDTSAQIVLTFDTQGNDLPVVQSSSLKFKSDCTYLVTGGFGGFGQKTAEWLIDNGARHLVLTGRTGADNEERRAFVQKLESRGASVLAAACDTSDLDSLSRLFDQIHNTLPPLKGIFHSGALIIDQPIAEMDLATFHKVMRSKALGALNLHQLSEKLPLDHFVLYSSVANLVGNSRQSAYSSANGFLNGLAHYRQLRGLAGTSVNWGAIADVGVVAQDEKLEQFLRYTGLRGINSAEGLDLLKQGLARNVAQFGVSVITNWNDWARFETRGGKSPRFAGLIAADSQGGDSSTRDALIEELRKLDPADQVELLASLITEIVASVLKANPESIPMDKAINQLGVDSLMATEIQMLLDTQLGLSVSILELIGDSTIRVLANQSLKSLKLDEQLSMAS